MKKCIYCGKGFDIGYPRTRGEKEEKFCSLNCRHLFNRALNKKLDTRICEICGSEFQVAKSSNLKRCPVCKEKQKQEIRIIPPQTCEVCGKEFNYDWRRSPVLERNLLPRFCSQVCSNTFSSQKTLGKTKTLICPVCNREFTTNIHTSPGSKCEDCSNYKKVKKENGSKVYQRKKDYKFPRNTTIGKFERSGLYTQKSCSLVKLGFNFENPNLEEEYLKIQKLLITEYEINLKSADQIEKEYGLAQSTFTTKLLKSFNIEKREKSGIMSASILNNSAASYRTCYQSGHHTDWEGKDHFLRSSYEFDLAKKLDERQIHYESEAIRVRYFDTQNRVYKTGVPDFYLPDFNMIIETKGSYFYDNENLADRKVELNKLGFKFYVLLEKEKVLEDFKPLEEIKDNYINIENFLKNLLL